MPPTETVGTEKGYRTRFTVLLLPYVLPRTCSYDDEGDSHQAAR